MVTAFFQLKIKTKQRFQVQRQFLHFEYDMNRTLDSSKTNWTQPKGLIPNQNDLEAQGIRINSIIGQPIVPPLRFFLFQGIGHRLESNTNNTTAMNAVE